MTTESIPAPQTELGANRSLKIKEVASRTRDFLLNAVLQLRTYRKAYPGIMHGLIFWGFTIQMIGHGINLLQMQLFIPFIELTSFPREGVYLAYELIMNLAGMAILVGVGMAIYRRFILRPKSLESRWDDSFALILIAIIPIAGFIMEAIRIVATSPPWAAWSPLGSAFAALMRFLGLSAEQAGTLHPYLFWGHAAIGLVFIAAIPFTKMRHLVTAPLNVIFRSRRKTGELEFIEDIEETEILGVGNIAEFKPQQLLSFDACVRCGRCEEACPASSSGMPYSPREFIQSLRTAMNTAFLGSNGKNGAHSQAELLGEAVNEESIWFCTTCSACTSGCPAFVNPIDEIIDLRRYQALTTGKLPKPAAETLRNLERQANPWGMPPEDRIAWMEGLDVRELAPGDSTDVLLFMGCATAYDERNKQVAQSVVKLLNKAGVDFGVLGLDEMCCGETARRLGHEYLYQEFARQNIEAFSKIGFNKIVAQCPHCFNTLKNEYPQLGGDFKVQHYTEFLSELPLSEIIKPANGSQPKEIVTFHDSCYLGRYNDIYKEPRQLLQKAGINQVDMADHGENSFCCGGGGGQMWLETDPNTRINHRRLAQALEAKASTVATACPYCLLMFDDALRSKGLSDQVQVYDIAEILAKQIDLTPSEVKT
jgi:Fe-S oxidoreductase/nitrate reductase gamma subunit